MRTRSVRTIGRLGSPALLVAGLMLFACPLANAQAPAANAPATSTPGSATPQPKAAPAAPMAPAPTPSTAPQPAAPEPIAAVPPTDAPAAHDQKPSTDKAEKPSVARLIESGDLRGAAAAAMAAAEAGDPDAQMQLALFYWHGIVQPQNFQESLRWVTLSAIGGNTKAPLARATIIKSVDDAAVKKIMEWVRTRLQKAGEQGDNRALVLLSASYAPEFGFPDQQEAYFWASVAVAAGEADARRRRDILLAGLKPPEVAKVQEKTTEWFGKWRKGTVK